MSQRFNHLVSDYFVFLRALGRRLLKCAPWVCVGMLPVVVVNQVAMIVAFMLPLKIIILLGSEGMPAYLAVVFGDLSRNTLIIYLGIGAVLFLLVYLIGGRLVKWISSIGGRKVIDQRGGSVIFDAEEEFAANIFSRVLQTWGTGVILMLGSVVGLLIEWRLVVVLMLVVLIEVWLVSRYWNRHLLPEHAQVRDAFVQNRVRIMQIFSAINAYIALAVLVVLFILEPETNFIVGLVLFILTRQILQRLVVATQDANYLMQKKDKINALVFPDQTFIETPSLAISTLEDQLMFDHRSQLFESIFSGSLAFLAESRWRWESQLKDGSMLYSTRSVKSEDVQYYLKVFKSEDDRCLSREKQLQQILGSYDLPYVPTLVDSGVALGRGFVIYKTPPLQDIKRSDLSSSEDQLWTQWTRDNLAHGWAEVFGHGDPTQIDRLRPQIIKRMGIACDPDSLQASQLQALLDALPQIQHALQMMPLMLINPDFKEGLRTTSDGQLVCLSWGRVYKDLAGYENDQQPNQTMDSGAAREADEARKSWGVSFEVWTLSARLMQLEKFISGNRMRDALALVDEILTLHRKIESQAR